MDETLHCNYCGKDLKMEFSFCPRCGTKIFWNDDDVIKLYDGIRVNDRPVKIYKKKSRF